MRARNIVLGLMLGAGLIAGGLYLLQVDFASGDVYPEYSSLRSDSSGSKLLYDTLARIPGIAVSRNLLPLDYLNGSESAVLLLNVSPYSLSAAFLKSADVLAARGNRVVTAMRELEQFDDIAKPEVTGPLDKTWHVRLGFDPKASASDRKLFIRDAAGWSVIGQSGAKLLAIERTVGKGSEVLFSDSGSFGNQSVADNAGFVRVSAAVGPYTKIVFDEQHLGIEQSGSVVGLARRFRLTGMALGFAICAALFIWRNAAAFPPPGPGLAPTEISGRGSRSGLLTLLRRHVPKSDLARVSWNEWLSTGRRGTTPQNIARAEEALRDSADPVSALSRIQSIVQSKGNH
jgi:hypothetical protein